MRTVKLYAYYCLVLIFLKFEFTFGNVEVHTSAKVEANGFSISDFISKFGYPIEVHQNIETEDGYLLDMFRIPYGKQTVDYSEGPKPVAFLMHGLLGSAENWVISGPEKGLAFLLADRGYDVWMGNARGSIHSRKHVKLTVKSKEFWMFSWHEIGVYDLPAKINYIIEQTKETQLVYIGHSQGTTAFFVMASEKVTFNANIKLMVALGPVAYLNHIPHPAFKIMSMFTKKQKLFTNLNGSAELIPNSELLNVAGKTLCQEQIIIQELCANILFLMTGYDSKQLERTLVPVIIQTIPAGASLKQFYHYAQELNSGKFRKYDYGVYNNMMKYGSPVPPSYDLSLVTAPVALFYSKNDWLVSTEDVERLAQELPNVVLQYLVPYEAFNHLDFLLAKDVVTLLYNEVFQIMNKFA